MRDWLLAGLLALGSGAFLLVGLAPYRFDFTRPARVRWLFIRPLNGLLNWLCFLPFGVLIASLSMVERPVIAATAYCAALSFIVEYLQRYLPGRYSCVSDWVLNVCGGAAGAAITVTWPPT